MDEKSKITQHVLELQGRKQLHLTGVKEVISFDLKEVVLNTVQGALIVRGDDLFLRSLLVEQGEVALEGRVDSLLYSDKPGKGKGQEPFMKRLFR